MLLGLEITLLTKYFSFKRIILAAALRTECQGNKENRETIINSDKREATIKESSKDGLDLSGSNFYEIYCLLR